ncbi:hypothetical protein [Turicibacter sp.]|uniref:hypothetical protein n=1 Tax=Turicibacter sp. TaxID=2049042 RepID=UPI001B5D7845|nr:hypothetical protein [Turicibacter sp.]MBP3905047.1 hypothetical protein [Turicibacter sp.]MBP3908046.1 hypothetical protein [Turicibacter sp.]
MNRTDEFFPKSILTKTEIIKDKNGNDKTITVKDYDKLSEIFLNKLNSGYDMTSLEALELLDVDRDWLLNNFRNEFDYFIVPKGVVGYALNLPDSSRFVDDICKKYKIKPKEAKYALQFKRMFINRQSFYDFIFKHLKITESLSVVTIENEEVNQLSPQILSKLKDEFLLKNDFVYQDKKTKKIKHFEAVKYSDLNQETFDLILKYEYALFENQGLKSPATLKEEMLGFYRERNRLLMVSNEQLNRKLEDELGLIKFSIVRESAERHPVRYFLKAPVKQQLDNDKFNFTISAKYDDRLEEIAKYFTAYALNYIKEQKSKKK